MPDQKRRPGQRQLPADRPCSSCDRSAPAVTFGTRRTGSGETVRKSRCRECESKAAVESRRRRREAERAGD